MAAGSTETFGSFNTDLLNTAREKFWSSDVMAAASTDSFWDDDPEEVVKKRVNELKRKFHNGRQLYVKHLPRDVTEEEIRELLADFPVQSVQLTAGTGSGTARATLEDPEMLEDWDKERVFLLRGQRLPVAPAPTEMMLCVARLPFGYTDPQFTALVANYGPIRRSFLMISEKTGESKGYGFVEYTTKEAALLAKNILDGKQIDGWILCCDWLESSHTTFESLHSKCLYVDQLPKDFRDMGKFRKVFSSVVNPPYCQIALKNGCPQDWGLVEFNTSEDAETTQVTLNGYNLCGQHIRISYYIPGVRAINLYLKLLNEPGRKVKSAGLLPDPPAPAVFQQLQNLAKQNPVFAQNLQNIIWTQIQSLQNGIENGKGTVPPGKGQLQTQLGSSHYSLLNNHQMLLALQNLLKQGSPSSSTSPGLLVVPQQMGPPPTTNQYQFGPSHVQEARKPCTNGKNGFMEKNQSQKVPLLPRPGLGISPPPGEAVPHSPFSSSPVDETVNIPHSMPRHIPPQVSVSDSNLWTGVLGQIRNQQSSVGMQPLEPNILMKNKCFDVSSGPKSPLQNDKVSFAQHTQSAGSKISSHPSLKGNSGMIGFPESMPGDLQQTISTILSNAQNLNQLLGSLTSAIQTNSNTCTAIPNRHTSGPYINQTSPLIRSITGPTSSSQPIDNTWPSQPVISVSSGQSSQSVITSPVPGTSLPANVPIMGSPSTLAMAAKPIGFLDMKSSQLCQPSFQNSWNTGAFFNSNSSFSAGTTLPCGTLSQFGAYSATNIVPNLWSHPGNPVLIASPPSGLVTPVGQKRKYNRLLPSPEPSPEGNYIGQHSQGLGGHYADSYFKRKKKN